MKKKLTSRKFWISTAAMLGSFAASISGIQTGNDTLVAVGIGCGVISAGIYAFCEAWTDSTSIKTEGGEEE